MLNYMCECFVSERELYVCRGRTFTVVKPFASMPLSLACGAAFGSPGQPDMTDKSIQASRVSLGPAEADAAIEAHATPADAPARCATYHFSALVETHVRSVFGISFWTRLVPGDCACLCDKRCEVKRTFRGNCPRNKSICAGFTIGLPIQAC